ncbi:MAG: hypothetical protein ACK56I_33260, partial [bacterium]
FSYFFHPPKAPKKFIKLLKNLNTVLKNLKFAGCQAELQKNAKIKNELTSCRVVPAIYKLCCYNCFFFYTVRDK